RTPLLDRTHHLPAPRRRRRHPPPRRPPRRPHLRQPPTRPTRLPHPQPRSSRRRSSSGVTRTPPPSDRLTGRSEDGFTTTTRVRVDHPKWEPRSDRAHPEPPDHPPRAAREARSGGSSVITQAKPTRRFGALSGVIPPRPSGQIGCA